MDFGRIVKWLVIILLIFAIWKYVIPWAKGEASSFGKSSSYATGATTSSPCLNAADRATSAWGGGVGRFVNPPYDMGAWSSFKSDVDSKIGSAQSECGACESESCRKVVSAMSELRSLVSDMDNAIRNGSSPGQDIVQRQEQIDNQIEAARELVRSGK